MKADVITAYCRLLVVGMKKSELPNAGGRRLQISYSSKRKALDEAASLDLGQWFVTCKDHDIVCKVSKS